jgi:hypothetical protein
VQHDSGSNSSGHMCQHAVGDVTTVSELVSGWRGPPLRIVWTHCASTWWSGRGPPCRAGKRIAGARQPPMSRSRIGGTLDLRSRQRRPIRGDYRGRQRLARAVHSAGNLPGWPENAQQLPRRLSDEGRTLRDQAHARSIRPSRPHLYEPSTALIGTAPKARPRLSLASSVRSAAQRRRPKRHDPFGPRYP